MFAKGILKMLHNFKNGSSVLGVVLVTSFDHFGYRFFLRAPTIVSRVDRSRFPLNNIFLCGWIIVEGICPRQDRVKVVAE